MDTTPCPEAGGGGKKEKTMFAALGQNPLARWLGALRRGAAPRRRTAPAAARRGWGRFVPSVQALEDRRLLALIQFGGNVLKETFDDLPATAITSSNTLDDPGYLNGVAVAPAVFRHVFDGVGAFSPGGDTTPTTQPPGQTAQDLALRMGPVGGDFSDSIQINPFLPPGATDVEVDQVLLDVMSSGPVRLTVGGKNGVEHLPPVPTGNTFTTLAASANDVIGKDAAGNDIKLGEIFSIEVDMHVTSPEDFMELDNVRALVFFPGIATPPVARDDVYELPQDAQPGQTFDSHIFHRSSDPNGSVLDNDTANNPGPFLAMPIRQPAHGFLAWNSNDDGTFIYSPDSTFRGTDSFTYVANGPGGDSNEATVTIVTAGSTLDTDGDGVPDDVEALVPPNKDGVYGDGNNDGTPDYLEPKVASLFDEGFQYWTLVASDGAFQDVSTPPVPASPLLPGGVSLTSGLFKFQLAGLAADEPAVVTLTPASDVALTAANAFYVLDPSSATWSSFNLDAGTGIGATLTGTDVTLHLPGSASGAITLQGGPANAQLTAYPGQATFVHHLGDFTTPPLTGRVSFLTPPGEAVTVAKVPDSETGGTVDLNADGTFVWHGSAAVGSFDFLVTDASGTATSGIATETIQIDDDAVPFVVATEDSPIHYGFSLNSDDNHFDTLGNLEGDVHTTAVEKGLFGYVYLGAVVVDHQATRVGFGNLSLIILKQPIRADQFTVNPDGTFRYLPLPGFDGADEFTFKVNDGYLDSNIATVFITVFQDASSHGQSQGLNAAETHVPALGSLEGGVGLVDPDPASQITDFQAVANPSPTGDFPPGTSVADFPIGFFQLVVSPPPGHETTVVHLSLPPDAPVPTHYYKFGPTPDDLTPHWYDFAFDNDPASPDFQTGAVFPGQTDPVTGEAVPAGVINLHFRALRRGDDNVVPGGPVGIVDAGGPGLFAPAASVTGPAGGTAGQPVTFTLSAADPSPQSMV
jgi:hypothetical protein